MQAALAELSMDLRPESPELGVSGVTPALTPFSLPSRKGKSMSAIATTSDDRFETDVLRASRPVLVDFGADWCPPCRAIAPHLEDLARSEGA
jgi:thiol-disulfide isomerase/thioredoxin